MPPHSVLPAAGCRSVSFELILERTEEGRLRALAVGVTFGRKHSYKPAQAEHVNELAAQGLPHRNVAAMVGLSATTVHRILQEA
jgi:DNA invertase Pin-like site-specific DNA recombinase